MQTVTNKVLRRIHAKGRGSVFTPRDFLDLGSRAAVDQILSRLTRNNTIRRLSRGLYDYPRISKRLGQLFPSPHAVARAVAKSTGHNVYTSGAHAANGLGLTTQVPARPVYLTDGPSRHVQNGRQPIYLRHTQRFLGVGLRARDVLHALDYLGKANVDDGVVAKLARSLSQQDKDALLRDYKYASTWMQPVLREIALAV
jgi:hypothetical protein